MLTKLDVRLHRAWVGGAELPEHLSIRDPPAVDGHMPTCVAENQVVDRFILMAVIVEVVPERLCDTVNILEADLTVFGQQIP